MNLFPMAFGGLQPIVDAPVWIVLLLKITAILCVAWAAHLTLKWTNPRWRVFLWRVTAVGLVALPATAWILPALKIHVRQAPSIEEAAAAATTTDALPASRTVAMSDPIDLSANPSDSGATRLSPMSTSDTQAMDAIDSSALPRQKAIAPAAEKSSLFKWPTLLMAVWLSGIVVLVARLIIGYFRIRLVVHRADQPAEWVRDEAMRVAEAVGCRRRFELLQSANISSPFLCGFLRPRLLLPAGMGEDSYRRDLPGILAHELSHIRSHDVFWNLGLQLISIVFWFHPLAWRMRNAHLAACELVCDAASASFVGDVGDYCRTLARVAVDACSSLPAAGIAMARTSAIGRRLSALKKRVFHLPLRRRSVLFFGLAALLTVSVVGTLRFALATPPEAEPTPPVGKTDAVQAETPPVERLSQPIPVKNDDRTTLDSILKRLKKEEERYESLEVIANSSYRHLNMQGPASSENSTICLEIDIRERNVFAKERLYHEEKQTSKVADGSTSSTLLRQAYDGKWTRQDRHSTSTNPKLKLKRWTSICLNQKDYLRLLRPHTILFHDNFINGRLLSSLLESGWYDERERTAMTVEHVGEELIDGLHCHKLKCALPRKGIVNSYFFLWLARDRNLLPIRSEWHQLNLGTDLPTGVNYVEDLRKISLGLWFPFKAVDLAYQKIGGMDEFHHLLQWRRDTLVEKVTIAPQANDKLFNFMEVPKDSLIHVVNRHGEPVGQFVQSETGNIEISTEMLHTMQNEHETNENDNYDPEDASAPERKRCIDAALKVLRADPPASQNECIEAALEILRYYRISRTNTKKWALAIRELILIGKPAIPKLIEEIDRVDHWANRGSELRALGFVLRGIGDPRAVPALIRALPYTLQPSYSSSRASVNDRELLAFMQRHDKTDASGGNSFHFGRPINEVLPALQKLTGINRIVPGEQDDQEFKNIHHICFGRKADGNDKKQKLFLRFAGRWADWWAKNWQYYVKDETEAQLEQTQKALDRISKTPPMQAPSDKPTADTMQPKKPRGKFPRILATSPAVGATDIDPATAEITVTFDRDMGEGFSWTGGGPNFPAIPEGKKPIWRDTRTCTLPVKLEPGRFYRVGVQAGSFRNFRSTEGVPARPSVIYFTTKGASDEVKKMLSKPKIVSITPPNGAKDADPSLAEIRVTFDIPMGKGMSWTGGGDAFPKSPEGKKAYWTEDGKTCVLPVKLEPGREYRIGLNSLSFNNFQSEPGIPLEPVAYTFRTRGE